jgi:periplasmic protein TonB
MMLPRIVEPGVGSVQRKTVWGVAIIGALLINLFLLSIMPAMNLAPPTLPKDTPRMTSVNMVRIKKPEVVRKKKHLPPKEKIKQPEKKLRRQFDDVQKLLQKKMRLPFHLDARIKSGLQQLPDLPIQTVSIKDADIEGIFSIDQLDEPLVVVSRVPPLYPIRAKREGIEGWVTVRFLVTEQGRVDHIEILDASPQAIFDQSVRRCVSRWRFKPGTINGEPVMVRATTTIRFEMED